MEATSDFFLAKDGIQIHFKHWKINEPKKILCIVHGLGEHSGRYHHIAESLAQADITTFALDLRGHGLSKGKKGHAQSLEILLSDIEELMKCARVKYNDIPMFVMGHSMGGNLVASLVTQKPTKEISGFILSAPWIRLAFEPPKWKIKLGQLISGLIPSLTQPNGLDSSYLSKDPDEVKAYDDDPLVHDKISAGLFDIIQKSAAKLVETSNINVRGLCYHGLSDQVIDPKATEEFANNNKLEWVGYENVFHEPHNDIEQDIVIKKLKDWIVLQ